MSDTLISLRGVTKDYGKNRILDNLNLDIKVGDSIALLGHNGSGKSTMLKIISGLTRVTKGEVIYHSDIKFNYIPEHFPKIHLTIKQYIKHMGLIEGLSTETINEKSRDLYKAFCMESMCNTPMKHLSKGTLQKVGVIQAIMTKPDILLLDEPLSGQDVESQNVFINYIHNLLKERVAVVMSCHERFLVRRLSNVVYEIEDRQLHKVNMVNAYRDEYDVLIFTVPEHTAINLDLDHIVDKMDYVDDKIKLVVERSRSNDVIKQLINSGYLLRGMHGE